MASPMNCSTMPCPSCRQGTPFARACCRGSGVTYGCPCGASVSTPGISSNQRRFIKFVTSLLLSRGCGPLDSFRLDANGPGIFLENFHDTAYLWICHALRSNVHTLSIMDHELKEEEEGEGESEDDEIPMPSGLATVPSCHCI